MTENLTKQQKKRLKEIIHLARTMLKDNEIHLPMLFEICIKITRILGMPLPELVPTIPSPVSTEKDKVPQETAVVQPLVGFPVGIFGSAQNKTQNKFDREEYDKKLKSWEKELKKMDKEKKEQNNVRGS